MNRRQARKRCKAKAVKGLMSIKIDRKTAKELVNDFYGVDRMIEWIHHVVPSTTASEAR